MSLFGSKSWHRGPAAIGLAAVLGVAGVARSRSVAVTTSRGRGVLPGAGHRAAEQPELHRRPAGHSSAARIENRQAVVDLVQQRREAAGCTATVEADQSAGQPAAEQPPAEQPAG